MRTYPSAANVITGVATSINAWIDQRAEQIGFPDDERLFGEFESDSEVGCAALGAATPAGKPVTAE